MWTISSCSHLRKMALKMLYTWFIKNPWKYSTLLMFCLRSIFIYLSTYYSKKLWIKDIESCYLSGIPGLVACKFCLRWLWTCECQPVSETSWNVCWLFLVYISLQKIAFKNLKQFLPSVKSVPQTSCNVDGFFDRFVPGLRIVTNC